MAVLAIFSGDISKEQYETLRKEIGWEVSNPRGAIFHVAGFDEQGGLHVADVWESSDALNDFVGSKLIPTLQKHSIPAPDAKVIPVHNANAYPTVDQFKLKTASKPKAKAKSKPKGKKRK
jgi:hypothetical protein